MPDEYVLYTDKKTYFVECKLNEVILSDSISLAMIFNTIQAFHFQDMLLKVYDLNCSINTFINVDE